MITTLRGIAYKTVPEFILVDKLRYEKINYKILWSSSVLVKLPEFNLYLTKKFSLIWSIGTFIFMSNASLLPLVNLIFY